MIEGRRRPILPKPKPGEPTNPADPAFWQDYREVVRLGSERTGVDSLLRQAIQERDEALKKERGGTQ